MCKRGEKPARQKAEEAGEWSGLLLFNDTLMKIKPGFCRNYLNILKDHVLTTHKSLELLHLKGPSHLNCWHTEDQVFNKVTPGDKISQSQQDPMLFSFSKVVLPSVPKDNRHLQRRRFEEASLVNRKHSRLLCECKVAKWLAQ